MFNLAYKMAWQPVRLAWRCIGWAWRRTRRPEGATRDRDWHGMATALGNTTPPVPRLPSPDGRGSQSFPPQAQQAALEAAREAKAAAASEAGSAAVAGSDAGPELARFHCREGDGFKLIFHFLIRKQRVRRTVWLDFPRLAKRMGREQAWAMRARLGHAQMRYAVDQPNHPWGRIELPEVRLEIDSTRGLKARSFMLETLDAVNAMIEAGGIALVSGRHRGVPEGDGVLAPELAAPRRQRGATGTESQPAQAELPLAAGVTAEAGNGDPPPMAAVLPDASDDNAGLPRGVTPEHVCTGILAAAGITERKDSSGRQYRIFYADIEVDGRLSRQTGVDLERALDEAKAHIGMRVRLQHLGYVPVNGGRHRRKVWQATVIPG